MSSFIESVIRNARVTVATLLALLIAGFVVYRDLPKDRWPDIQLPFIYVMLTLEGVSPDDAERLLARPMEQKLRSIEGLKELRSLTYLGGASVVLELDAGQDVDAALDDVRQQVDLAKPDLPEDADEPVVHEVAFSRFPVVVVTLSGDVPERTLLRLAERLQDKIEAIGAVLETQISGKREELVELVIDPLRLEAYGLQVDEVGQIVGRSNRLVAAGTMDTGQGRFAIKVPGLFENAKDILDMPLKVSGDAVTRVRDVATLRRTFKDPQSLARIDGLQAIGIEVSKRANTNIIDTIAEVRRVTDAESANWPEQVKITYSQDVSADIRSMLRDLENNLITAVLLVLIVVVASLGLRGGLIAGIAVPGSFLIGILMLAGFGITINIVVLFSLILATGMLVDGAIILVEYADRCMLNGMARREAYLVATRKMAWPIFSSIMTIVAAFGPMAFWPGTIGEFMKYLPITLSATLFASLLMAMVFIPCIGSLIGAPNGEALAAHDAETLSVAQQLRRAGWFDRLYLSVLRRALNHPLKVIALGIVILAGTAYAYIAHFNAGAEFFPNVEPDRATLQIHARGNMSVDERDAIVRQVETGVLAMQDKNHELASVYTVVKAEVGGRAGGQELPEDVIGLITLEFADWNKRRKADVIIGELRSAADQIPGIQVEVQKDEGGPQSGKPIHLQLSSQDHAALDKAAAIVRKKLDAEPGLLDVEDSRPVPGIEWQITVDRAEAAKYGADVTSVGNAVQLVTRGLKFGDYRPDDSDDEIDIVARFPESVRNLSELDQLRVPTPAGVVPLSNFVKRTAEPKLALVHRVDGKRVIDLKADVAPGVQTIAKIDALKGWLPTSGIDPNVDVAFRGEEEDRAQTQSFLTLAFGATMFLIAIILLMQFNSFFSVLLVLSAVVMSSIGVMFGLMLMQQPFGIVMTGIGVIALAGIIVNNNIVFIDTYDQLRAAGTDRRDALLLTGVQRLRPVILTKLTTVLGLLPMAFKMNIDFMSREITFGAPSTQWWSPLATAVTFGVLFASPLTLIFTPCALAVQGRLGDLWTRLRARRRSRKLAHG